MNSNTGLGCPAHPGTLLFVLLLGAVTVFAQDADPKGETGGDREAPVASPKPEEESRETGPASMDDLSRQVLTTWRKQQYDLGWAGAGQGRCEVRVTIGEPPGLTAEATGIYEWDGESGRLDLYDSRIEEMLARQGWSARKLDMFFDADRLVDLKGATLTAERSEAGTTVQVDNGKPGGVSEVRFDPKGVLTTAIFITPSPEGPVEATLSFEFE